MERKKVARPTLDNSKNHEPFFRVQAKINNQNSTTSTVESQNTDIEGTNVQSLDKHADSKTAESEVILDKKQKAALIATVMAESAQGLWEYREIAWVYLNLMRNEGIETGLNRSSAYKQKNIWYKAYMIQLGEGASYKDDIPTGGYMTVTVNGEEVDAKSIGEYVEKNDYFKLTIIPRLTKMKEFIENDVLKKQKSNPIPSFTGQGYWRDLNNLGDKGDHWDMVRMYYVKFLKGEVTGKYIKVIGSGKNTTFLFDLNGIQQFFKKYPDALPKNKKDIPQLLFDQLAPK